MGWSPAIDSESSRCPRAHRLAHCSKRDFGHCKGREIPNAAPVSIPRIHIDLLARFSRVEEEVKPHAKHQSAGDRPHCKPSNNLPFIRVTPEFVLDDIPEKWVYRLNCQKNE
jgi:hypothetical protein